MLHSLLNVIFLVCWVSQAVLVFSAAVFWVDRGPESIPPRLLLRLWAVSFLAQLALAGKSVTTPLSAAL